MDHAQDRATPSMAQLAVPSPHECGMTAPKGRTRLLCVNNGGMTVRAGRPYVHGANAVFLRDLGVSLGSVRFAGWVPESNDPLQQVCVDDIPGVHAWPLPHVQGAPWKQVTAILRAARRVAAAVAWSDFVYAYCPGRLSMLTTLWARRLRKPYGVYVRGMLDITTPPWRHSLRGAQFALATGEELRRVVAQWCREAENVTPMTWLRHEHLLLERPARRAGPFRILYVGRLDLRKGTRDLLEAAALLWESGLEYRVALVGHCESIDALEMGIPDGVRQRLEWVGVIPDFAPLVSRYLDADVFVLPSHDEGFPRVLYEAMALGVPVITTMVGSIPTVMHPEENCVAIDVGRPDQIAVAVRRVHDAPALAARLGQRGRADMAGIIGGWRKSHAVQVLERICASQTGSRRRGN